MVNSLPRPPPVSPSLSLSLHDKLSDSDCDGWTSGPRQDVHFQEADTLPKLDRCANKRYDYSLRVYICFYIRKLL